MERDTIETVGIIPDILQLLHKKYIHHMNLELGEEITAEQLFLLQQIHQCGRCNSSELAHITSVKRSAITIMINRLVNKEYVIRIYDERDRRIIWLETTEKAEVILEKSTSIMSNILNEYMTDITVEERNLFIKVARKMYAGLSEK